MDYGIVFVVGFIVGYFVAWLMLKGKLPDRMPRIWPNPAEFKMTGGKIVRGTSTINNPLSEPLQKGDKLSTGMLQWATIDDANKQCRIKLAPLSEALVWHEDEDPPSKASYKSIEITDGDLWYFGFVSPTLRTQGPGRRFVTRCKGKAVGARGTDYHLAVTSTGFDVTVFDGFVDIWAPVAAFEEGAAEVETADKTVEVATGSLYRDAGRTYSKRAVKRVSYS